MEVFISGLNKAELLVNLYRKAVSSGVHPNSPMRITIEEAQRILEKSRPNLITYIHGYYIMIDLSDNDYVSANRFDAKYGYRSFYAIVEQLRQRRDFSQSGGNVLRGKS